LPCQFAFGQPMQLGVERGEKSVRGRAVTSVGSANEQRDSGEIRT